MWKNKKLKECFILLLLLFSLVVTAIPPLVSADDPTVGPYVAPGAPDGITIDQLLKIGILHDMNDITGEHAWDGSMLAAREINEAGGLVIDSTQYYIGLVTENTFEAEPELDIDKGIDAANLMIADYDPHIITGGFRLEALIEYLEPIMDAQIPFICTGAASNIFSENVLNNYARYKYFFRTILNASKIGGDLFYYIPYLANEMTVISGKDITKIAILREDSEWTVSMANVLINNLPFFGLEVVEDFVLPLDASEQDLRNVWYQIDMSGAQIVVPLSTSGLGISIGRTYGEVQPRCIMCGINRDAQLGNYWDDTYGNGQYEITIQGTYRTEKTPKTIPFWDNFVGNYSMEPYYTAVSSYDAIYLLANATLSTQSFNADDIVSGLEQIDSTNTYTGVEGNIAFTASHDYLGGPDYSSILFCQWQDGGTKVVLPCGNMFYPDSFATGSLVIPEWGINPRELICGLSYAPDSLDPLNTWDNTIFNVIDQSVETLLAYDLSAPDLEIIPRLATNLGTWSVDNLNYTIPLKTGILFHDGTPFDAYAVQWNFDRLAYFMNITGMLPPGESTTIVKTMYLLDDGTPIINSTEVIDPYTIKFVLNRPYGPFDALLCFSGSGMLSPASTPDTEYIDLETGDVIGTGPFEYDYYIPDDKVKFHAFEDYWAGAAEIKELVFKIIYDTDERHQALLSGIIDLLNAPLNYYIDTMRDDPNLSVIDAGGNLIINWLGMNNKQINITWREAISYAIDYNSVIDGLLNGHGIRLKSPVPEGIRYANWAFDVATTDIKQAREIMQSMGFGVGWDSTFPGSDEAQWTAANFRTLNYTYNLGNYFREGMFDIVTDSLELIGIRVEDAGLTWNEFKDRIFNQRVTSAGHDALQLFCLGWIPDLNDPSTYINSLFSNISVSNAAQVNDPYLQNLMEEGIKEVDQTIREAIYDEIQRYLVEELKPWAFLSVGRNYDAYRKEIDGYQSNPWDKVWFHGVEFQDLVPPHTSINIVGDQNSYGWFESDVIITLSATDYFSGVQTTEYSVDGETWLTYTEPIIISEDGMTLIYYRSIDYNGNIEETKIEKICKYSFFSARDLIFGTKNGLSELEPLDTWDYESWDVFDQVLEGLFAHDLSHPEMELIPRLAAEFGTWSPDGLTYTVTLRTGVTFHDGTPFNADAVQWNFDRLAYFMNVSGTLPPDKQVTMIESLYRWDDWTPIIHHTEVVNPYTIRFVLNRPYAALEALLASSGTYIHSPFSTPEMDYIDTFSGSLVGTGPYIFDFHIQDTVTKFHAFMDYWGGPPNVKRLIFSIIEDDQSRNDALLSGEVDFILNPLPSMYDAFETDPSITLYDAGNTGLMMYIGMNNRQINKTMRQAISYAINYSHIINEIMEGQGVRLKSPLPKGIPYANWSLNVALMNITRAREILLDAGVVIGLDPLVDSDWTNLIDFGTPIASYNYSYNIGNWRREAILYLLQDNLRQIGIQVLDAGMTWQDYVWRLLDIYPYSRDMLQLFEFAWLPDFGDPSNYLDSNLLSESPSNFALVNDPYLQDLLAQGIVEVDPNMRRTIYNEIQRYLVEDLMPWAFTFSGRNFYAYNDEFTGYEPNTMQKLWFFSISRVPLPKCNETAEWGVNPGEQIIWDVSGYWLEMMSFLLHQESPAQWMMDIHDVSLTYWEDLPFKNVPYDYYSTIWATMYNRSVTEGAPWEEMMPLSPLVFYNACEQFIYNQLFAAYYQNWIHLLIPTPVNLEILNKTIFELFQLYNMAAGSTIEDNSLEIILDIGTDLLTINYTYNNQGILTYGTLKNSTGHLWLEIRTDVTPPTWIEIPTDQFVELGTRFSYQVSAFDESGIDHYWISDTENFEIDNNGLIVDKDFLELGVYELEVRAYDPYGHYCSATILITVTDSTPPFGIDSVYDTIPNITILTYTRTPQIIGTVKVFDNSPIANVELWNVDPIYDESIDEGFTIVTTHHPKSPLGIYDYSYTSDIVIMTTTSLKEGEHTLNLRVYDAQGNVANKYFNITVFRVLSLKLSGEFDYLEKEKVKISIVANLLDAETNMEVNSLWITDMGVVVDIIIWDPDGNIVQLPLGTTQMTYMSGGTFQWEAHGTISDLKDLFKKGVYMVSADVKFYGNDDPYYYHYLVNEDVIQFHVDPPVDEDINLWIPLILVGFAGFILLNLALNFFYKRKHRRIV
ncbi:MAG: ABC transporter substrate-binding protein [Promethearchaeota archaeon]